MYSQLFDITGRLISCIVSTLIFFRYFDARYERKYPQSFLYIVGKVSCCVFNFFIYLFNVPALNMLYWSVAIIFLGSFLYCECNISKIRYHLTNVSFFLAYAICESIGCLLVSTGVNVLGITQNASAVSFVYTVGGSATAVILYYLLLQKFFVQEKVKKITALLQVLYAVITVYVLINIGSILFLLQHTLTDRDCLFLLLDAVLVIVINLYLFYLLDNFTENKDLTYKVALYESVAKSNYDYYTRQVENNKKAVSVIHDIKEKMRIMRETKNKQTVSEACGYAEAFEEMIEPLIIKRYSDSAILNIILNEKAEQCKSLAVSFTVDVQPVSLDFMQPIDITTIFGNILDNAIEACSKAEEKLLCLQICPFNEMIYVQLTNTYTGELMWNASGRPITQKGTGHGIGLENVENTLRKYNGSMECSEKDNQFSMEIMFSK